MTLDILNAGSTPADIDAVTAAATDVDTAVTVLVNDGATPTQAHVTTLSGAWTVLSAAITALSASVSPGAADGMSDAILSFDAATVETRTRLRQAVAACLLAVEGSDALDP
jgi:hypothetical protein